MIQILSDGDRHLLEPLCCNYPLEEIQMAGSTLGVLLKEQWAKTGKDVTVSSWFWPSEALLKKASELTSFTVRSASGKIAAHTEKSGVMLDADPDCLEIQFPWDVLALHERILSGFQKSDIRGTVRELAVVDGILILGEGSVILPGVYIEGTAVIGKNCKIGPNCYLRGKTSIADGCHVGQAVEIKNSILQEKTAAGHLSYIGDSIVGRHVNFGAGTITSNFRHDGMNHKSMVDGQLVNTGRRKFGSIIGDNVHTGIHTSIYPGRKIWPGIGIRPGEIIRYDLHG